MIEVDEVLACKLIISNNIKPKGLDLIFANNFSLIDDLYTIAFVKLVVVGHLDHKLRQFFLSIKFLSQDENSST